MSSVGPLYTDEPVAFAPRTLAGPALTVDAEPVDIGDIELEQQSVIEGLVVGQTGAALPDTRVMIYRIDGALPDRELAGLADTDALAQRRTRALAFATAHRGAAEATADAIAALLWQGRAGR